MHLNIDTGAGNSEGIYEENLCPLDQEYSQLTGVVVHFSINWPFSEFHEEAFFLKLIHFKPHF